MWAYTWPWILWLFFLGAVLWAAVSWRSYGRYYRDVGSGGYGARYGGPDFGIPQGWGQRGVHKGHGPRDYHRADPRIEEDINDQLTLNDAIDAREVHVSVHDGQVVLTGVVESRADKKLAETIADCVAGTVDVENRLAIGKVSS
jgi:hypothetical protein